MHRGILDTGISTERSLDARSGAAAVPYGRSELHERASRLLYMITTPGFIPAVSRKRKRRPAAHR
eukprot:scaffold13331_cov33-Phaeocystis_antarctica.AAC.1